MRDISLVIPTYNGPSYLLRSLSYYSSVGVDFPILIADSSSDENKKRNQEVIKRFPDLNILHLDDYPTTIIANLKIFQTFEWVQSRYSVLCGDDDLVTREGIYRSIEFLNNNPDFSAVYGRYIGFRLNDGKSRKRKFRWHLAYSSASIEFPNAEDRLEYHLSAYVTPTFYAVHRTDQMKKVFREALSATDDDVFCEILLTMLTVIYGKVKCLDILYGARDAEPGRGGHSPSLLSALESGTFDGKYARFKDRLSTHLIKQSGLSVKEASELIDKCMSSFLYVRGLKTILPIPDSKKRAILNSLPLPDWTKRQIVKLYATVHKVLIIRPATFCSTTVDRLAFLFSSNRNELNRIRTHLLSYSK